MILSTGSVQGAGVMPAYPFAQDALYPYRSADAEVRRNVQKAISTASADAIITPNITYTIGPDGQLYAVGGTISTTRKLTGTGAKALPQNLQQDIPVNPDTSRRQPPPLSQEALKEFVTRDLGLGSADFAALFGEQNAQDTTALTELRAVDIGVRSHEAQHFRAAGGLVQGTPEFDFIRGEDGQYYAVGGHVDVSSTATNDPAKAKRDATTFANAALAPGDASSQDLGAARGAFSNAAEAYTRVAYQTRYPDKFLDLVG